jgi:hypothetical protein
MVIAIILSCNLVFAQEDPLRITEITTTESRCENNGTMTIDAGGGSEPYIYKLLSGPAQSGPYPSTQTTSTFYSLHPGAYTIQVEDAVGALVNGEVLIVGDYNQPDLYLSTEDPKCPGGSDGIVYAMPVDGRAPFTYEMLAPFSIDNGTDSVFTGLPAGEYQIRAMDSCGNFQTREIELIDPVADELTSSIFWNIPRINCDNARFTVTKSGGTPPFSYEVIAPAGYEVGPQDDVNFILPISDDPPNNPFTYTFKVTDACGQESTCTGRYSSYIYTNVYNVSCSTFTTAVLNFQRFGQDLTYEIISGPPGLDPLPPAQQNDNTFYDLPFGSYTIRVTNECGETRTLYRTQNAPYSINASISSMNVMTCDTGFAVVRLTWSYSAPRPYTINVFEHPADYPGNITLTTNSSLPVIDSLTIGHYEVEIRDGCGGKDTVVFDITEVLQVSLEAEGIPGCGLNDQAIDAEATTNGSLPLFYELYKLPSTSRIGFNTTGYFPNLDAGTYLVQVYKCSSSNPFASQLIELEGYVQPDVLPAKAISCGDGTMTITGNGKGGIKPYLFEILDASLNRIAGPQSNPVFPNIPFGTNYRMRISDDCGNSSISDVSVVVNGLALSLVTEGNDCIDSTFMVRAIDSVSGFTFAWVGPNGMVSNSSMAEFDPLSSSDAGTYTVEVNLGNCAEQTLYFAIDADPDCDILSVDFLDFNLRQLETEHVLLTWSTESEVNNNRFEIERSIDSRFWEKIGQVEPANQIGRSHNYAFTDIHPSKGMNYYRLRQVDHDGSDTYSWIESINMESGNKTGVYPNPASDRIYFDQIPEGSMINIFDAKGQLINKLDSMEIKGQLDISSFVSGVYLIQINDGKMSYMQKLFVE